MEPANFMLATTHSTGSEIPGTEPPAAMHNSSETESGMHQTRAIISGGECTKTQQLPTSASMSLMNDETGINPMSADSSLLLEHDTAESSQRSETGVQRATSPRPESLQDEESYFESVPPDLIRTYLGSSRYQYGVNTMETSSPLSFRLGFPSIPDESQAATSPISTYPHTSGIDNVFSLGKGQKRTYQQKQYNE